MTKKVNKKLVKGFSFIPTFSHAGRIHAVSGISASSNKIHVLFNFHPSDHVELSTCLSNPRFAKNLDEMQNIMMQRTANENAACLRRICKRSDQPKIERLVNNYARLILR